MSGHWGRVPPRPTWRDTRRGRAFSGGRCVDSESVRLGNVFLVFRGTRAHLREGTRAWCRREKSVRVRFACCWQNMGGEARQ